MAARSAPDSERADAAAPPLGLRLARYIGLRGLPSPVVSAAVVAALLGACWLMAVGTASATATSRHWFYVPVVFAAVRFGLVGALLTGTAAGLLAGPLVPLPADQAALNSLSTWGTRAAFLVAIGALVALLVRLAREGLERQLAVAERERALEGQRSLLLQSVSHEFRTPLTSILGVTQTLRRVDPDGERRDQLLDALERATHRLDDLVAVFLAATERSAGAEQTAVDVPTTVGEVADMLAHLDGPARVSYGGQVGTLVTDAAAFTLLLRILVENALKFSPAGSPVVVETRSCGETVEVHVQDRGTCMDAAEMQRAFECFTQVDEATARARGGLGIGLFAADKVVRQLAGAIELAARPEGGTDATVRLPQRRASDAGAQRPQPRPERSGSRAGT